MTRKRRGRAEGSVYQRESDGLWVASASLGYDGAGRRRRKTVYGSTKAEALAKLEAARRDGPGGESRAGKCSLGEFLDGWLESEVAPNLSPGTVKSYRDAVRLHVKPHAGRLPLAKLTPEQVTALYAALRKGGAGARTVELTHVVLKRALSVAVKWGRLRSNPAALVTRPKYERAEKPAVTAAQVQALLKAAEGHRLQALLVLAARTGLRQGELFALHWGDVDREARTLSVRHSLEELNGALRLKAPKSASGRRTVELDAAAAAALEAHRGRMLAEEAAMLAGGGYEKRKAAKALHGDGGVVFCDLDGGYLRKSNFLRGVFAPIRAAAGLKIVFHQLRHFHGTFHVEQGTDARTLQQRLGHADVATTLRFYVTPGRASHKKAADAFGAAFDAAGAEG